MIKETNGDNKRRKRWRLAGGGKESKYLLEKVDREDESSGKFS